MKLVSRKLPITILFIISVLLLNTSPDANAQDNRGRGVYRLHITEQSPYFYRADSVCIRLTKGSFINLELEEGRSTTIKVMQDTCIYKKQKKKVFIKEYIKGVYLASEVKHEDDKPGVLIINPWTWSDDGSSQSPEILNDKQIKDLNTKHYVDIAPNKKYSIWHNRWDYGALTIPFAIRPELNDTTKTSVTTDLNAAFHVRRSWNLESYKNRRIKAKMSSKGISLGALIGFSQIDLTPSNTDLDESPLTSSEDGLSIFLGPALAFNLFGAQLAIVYAWDFG